MVKIIEDVLFWTLWIGGLGTVFYYMVFISEFPGMILGY